MLVGDQGNHLITQLGQESVGSVYQCQLGDYCRRSGITYRINLVRFLETTLLNILGVLTLETV